MYFIVEILDIFEVLSYTIKAVFAVLAYKCVCVLQWVLSYTNSVLQGDQILNKDC